MNRRQILAGLAASSTGASSSHARAPGLALADLIDPVFADIDPASSPGFGVAVYQEGEIRFARGYGLADLDHGQAITVDTVFHLASLSKQFTAAAVALLVLEGRLDLDAPLAAFLEPAARFTPQPTLAHLVYMTSGLPDYTTTRRISGLPWQSFFHFTRDEAIERTLAQPSLAFSPGSAWSYSNVNYMILSRVVEMVSGQSFGAFMQSRVFGPLGMSASFVDDDTTRVVPHRATGYAARTPMLEAQAAALGLTVRAGPGYARLTRVSPHFGGSGVFTSLVDLARWDANWTRGRLGEGFTELMTRTRAFAHDKVDDAMGLVMGRRNGQSMIWYSGGDLDTSTWMARFPESGLTVACLSNLASDSAERRGHLILDRLAAEALGQASNRGWRRRG